MLFCLRFFFFKQKTAYEMRISDWSSDVCSSDLSLEQKFRLERSGLTRKFYLVEGTFTRAIAHRYRSLSSDAIEKALKSTTVEGRSEERRVGTECVSTCRYRRSP